MRESLPYEDGGSTVMPNEKGKGLATTKPKQLPPPPHPTTTGRRQEEPDGARGRLEGSATVREQLAAL